MATTVDGGQNAAEVRGSNARGIAAMVIAMACFVTSDTVIKVLGRDMPVGQIMFLRGLLSVLLILPLVAATGALAKLRFALTPIVALRAASEVGATVFFFSGLVLMPFADAAAIGQFAPLAVTAGAAMFMKEPVGWRRWLATVVGLIGVLLIIRPGSGAFNPAAILLVMCVLCVAVRDLVTRTMALGIPALVLILVSSVATTITGLGGRLFETWIMPNAMMMGSLACRRLAFRPATTVRSLPCARARSQWWRRSATPVCCSH
jgi:drug/metabolite transporter (DMT)-like permease